MEGSHVGDLDVTGGICLLAAIAAVGVTSIGVEGRCADAVDVQDGGVVILDAADDLRDGGGVRDGHLRAEIVGGVVVAVPVRTADSGELVGRAVGGDAFIGFLAAEGAAGGLPLGIVEVGGGPAGAVIALGSRIARRVAVVVQISPDGRVINFCGYLRVFP